MAEQNQPSANKHDGFALAASAAAWGGLFWLIPSDIGFSGFVMWFCYIAGAACIAVSFAGALTELENLTGHEAFGWMGVGALFQVIAILSYLATVIFSLGGSVEVAAKLAAYGLTMFGIPFFLYGVSAITSNPPRDKLSNAKQSRGSRKDTILTILAFASSLIPIVGAITKAFL